MMGYANEADVMNALSTLERALKKMGADFEPGVSLAAAQASLME